MSNALASLTFSPNRATIHRIRPLPVIGYAITLSAHLLMLLVLLLPSEPTLQSLPDAKTTEIIWPDPPLEIKIPPPPPPIPVSQPRPLTRPVSTRSTTLPVPLPMLPTIIQPSGDMAMSINEPVAEIDDAVVSDSIAVGQGAGPIVASMQLIDGSAPDYPRQAVQRRLTGTVVLLILVDRQGKPVSVEIEQTSGHAMLDRHAKQHVLRRWRFAPSLRDGVAVSAYARVPVDFNLPYSDDR